MNVDIERHWYQASLTLLTLFLLPFSWLFRAIVSLRRFLYRIKIKKSFRFPAPVIVVGNITVGGTGKTPFVLWLANTLRAAGYIPGIVSRGIGGEKHLEPYWVNAYADVREVGDEAILLAKHGHCPVVICIDRVAAVKELLAKSSCNVVICDDGLQHYRLQRMLEIAMIDGARHLGNQQLLPAGPLREPVSRLKQVDFIIRNSVSSKPENKTPKEFTMILQGNVLVAVNDEAKRMPLNQFPHRKVHAVAAIGNPKRFFTMLRECGFDVIEHPFPDHYFFREDDLKFADDLPVIMTEKDAVKCHAFLGEKLWYIPVEVVVDDVLRQRILDAVNGGHTTRKERG